ncbi:unnamed protein product [Ixodes hexagonus]
MPTHCCVPLCKRYGYANKSGRKVSYHKFPTDVAMKKRWIAAIKRDEGPFFSVSKATKVCSEHFVEGDFWKGAASGRQLLRDTAVPSVFAFQKVKPSRKAPLQRSACAHSGIERQQSKKSRSQEHCMQANRGNQPPPQDAFPEQQSAASETRHESGTPLQEQANRENQPPPQDAFPKQRSAPSETRHESQAPLQEQAAKLCKCSDTIVALQAQLATSKANESRLQNELHTHLAKSRNELRLQSELEAELARGRKLRAELEVQLNTSKLTEVELQAEVSRFVQEVSSQCKELDLLRNNLILAQRDLEKLKEESVPFGIEKFRECDDDILFYTGLPRYSSFVFLLEFLDPGENGKNIKRHQKASSGGHPSHESRGRRRKVTVENQLFLVLVKLHLGLFHQHLGHLFSVSTSTVSRIFSSWVDFMYLQLSEVPLWLPRHAIDASMPEAFLAKYPTTRVLLDATEVRCEVPTLFVTQSELYSHYKSTHTFKGLVGVSPCGLLTFVSELFTGCTSDRECVIRSGFLELEFDHGDSIMADKGFRIEDLIKEKGVTLNIPPFLKNGQLTAKEAQKTQEIAALRIHVERKFSASKAFIYLTAQSPFPWPPSQTKCGPFVPC